MRRAPTSRLLRLACLVLAALFVLEPAVIAAGPCAAGRWLGSASACCCAAAATEPAARSQEAPGSCCTGAAEQEDQSSASEVGRASCRCELEAPSPLLPSRDPRSTEITGAGALERWIALGALASARVEHPARLETLPGADPPPPDSVLSERTGARDLAGSGCARGVLASGGTRGLLAITCCALL